MPKLSHASALADASRREHLCGFSSCAPPTRHAPTDVRAGGPAFSIRRPGEAGTGRKAPPEAAVDSFGPKLPWRTSRGGGRARRCPCWRAGAFDSKAGRGWRKRVCARRRSRPWMPKLSHATASTAAASRVPAASRHAPMDTRADVFDSKGRIVVCSTFLLSFSLPPPPRRQSFRVRCPRVRARRGPKTCFRGGFGRTSAVSFETRARAVKRSRRLCGLERIT